MLLRWQIGSKNISVVEKLIPNYNFHYMLLAKNQCGGVGINTPDSLTNVVVMEEIKLNMSCDCVKCETERLFIEFCYRDTAYTLGESIDTQLEK